MKKLILVMVFVLLTAVFIAFNYLLWERESREKELTNLQNLNVSNNASISAQSREIDNLQKEIGNLGNNITQLENEKNQLMEDKSGLVEQKAESDTSLRKKIDFINIIKQYADIKAVSESLTKWADALNQGKYEEAYELEYAAVPSADRTVTLSAYTQEMQKTVKKIEVTEVQIDKLRGAVEGEIFLDVRLTVKLAENPDKVASRFVEGLNERYVKIDYSMEDKAFIISAINNY